MRAFASGGGIWWAEIRGASSSCSAMRRAGAYLPCLRPRMAHSPRSASIHGDSRLAQMQRWATFDCYGTLVDWNAGIAAQLERLLGDGEGLLARYHEIEPEIERERPEASYRDVMAVVLAQLAEETGMDLPAGERDALARSLPEWPVFDEVPDALGDAHARGWKLVALSNSDRD